MGKKIVAVNSSRVNGNTVKKLHEIGNILKSKGYDYEIIHLMKNDVRECVGCEQCLRGNQCCLKDDMPELMDKLKEAHGVVLSSPVYMFNVCGRLKTFADRTCSWFHRPALAGKAILNVITTSGSGIRDAERYMKKLDYQWGGYPSGTVRRKVTDLEKVVQEDEIKDFINNLQLGSSTFKPSLNMMIMFNMQKILAEKVLKHDREFWEEKNWINSHYFYDCKMNIAKKTVAKMFYKHMFKKIKREA